jgi:3-hydroxyisobutyrate dehydrogenase
MSVRKVGFAGLGLMGSRMARTLKRRGFEVTVWNRTLSKADPLKAEGILVAPTPQALAQQVDVFCTCVADPSALTDVGLGPQGLLSGARPGQIFIDFSTVSPETIRTLDEACVRKQVGFVEAPVTGSKIGAENGSLVLMVGGKQEHLEQAWPVLLGVGERIVHCGDVGAGTQVKLAGNALIAAMLQAFSEGMLSVTKAGVDPRRFLEVVQASGFRSPYFDFKAKSLLAHDFETHFSIALMHKDLSLFLQNAAALGVEAPSAACAQGMYQQALDAGKGEQDIGAVITVLEERAKTRIGGA